MKQKHDRYEMHKYWGKKPAFGFDKIIKTYSKPDDVLFDPFAGYGVFGCEALLNNRKVVLNDLNPIAGFIQNQLLKNDFNEKHIKETFKTIIGELSNTEEKLFTTTCSKCGKQAIVISTLRDKNNDKPLCHKVKCYCSKQAFEQDISEDEAQKILNIEKNLVIPSHPSSDLIQNSRISAKENMTTDDLFTIRTLYCHSLLYNQIQRIENEALKEYLMLAFLSNMANCSKLVPPIKSRGKMSQGAWMTGFYIANNYIENNVFHYFKNRIEKIIAGKKDFCSKIKNINLSYKIINNDAKKLSIPNDSIDFIFTDPPYGDTVPYFEQSIIWNTWLSKQVDYENEIVISDSKIRNKNNTQYKSDLNKAISEISRVLKPEKYFTISFHSLYGEEWSSLIDACFMNGFSFEQAELLKQKTLAPRQLNRKITVEGDLLLTFKKTNIKNLQLTDKEKLITKLTDLISDELYKNNLSTNDIYLNIINYILKNRISLGDIDIINLLKSNFDIDDCGMWHQKPILAALAMARY